MSANDHAVPSESADTSKTECWQALPDRVRGVWWVNAAIQSVCWLAGGAIASLIFQTTGWWSSWSQASRIAALTVIVLIAAGNLAIQPLQTRYEFAFDRFLIGDHDIRIRTGWLFHKTVTVPYNRVQHVDTEQGPVMRHFNLVSLEIHTASSEHEIEALESAEAQRLCNLISARVMASKENL